MRGGTRDLGDDSTNEGISIHPPREGWDAQRPLHQASFALFQSTHPVRGGTLPQSSRLCHDLRISIHPPREGWDYDDVYNVTKVDISIHPPREGWDFSQVV